MTLAESSTTPACGKATRFGCRMQRLIPSRLNSPCRGKMRCLLKAVGFARACQPALPRPEERVEPPSRHCWARIVPRRAADDRPRAVSAWTARERRDALRRRFASTPGQRFVRSLHAPREVAPPARVARSEPGRRPSLRFLERVVQRATAARAPPPSARSRTPCAGASPDIHRQRRRRGTRERGRRIQLGSKASRVDLLSRKL